MMLTVKIVSSIMLAYSLKCHKIHFNLDGIQSLNVVDYVFDILFVYEPESSTCAKGKT